MLNFLNNLANLIFGSVWALFLIGLGIVVFFIGGAFIWHIFDLSNTWWKWLLGIVAFIILFFWSAEDNRKYHENWAKRRKKRTQEIIDQWKKEGKI